MYEKLIDIINDWNPIEIYPLLQDEYFLEIRKIINGMNGNLHSIETLTDLIYNVFTECFGSMFTKSVEDCKVIAKQIIHICQ